MVKTIGLETRRSIAKLTPKLTPPKRNPRFDRNALIVWRTKKMDVIRHNDVSADHP